jgi:aerobic-type carbon monoxide dehydrogenase small subunit (CoxS/CutS family)
MAAPAARPYDSVSLNLNGRAVRVEAHNHMPLLRPLRDILGSGEISSRCS